MHGKVFKFQKKVLSFKKGARKQFFLKKANRDRPGTQSRTNCACFGTTFSQSGSSRDPVGTQSGAVGHRCPEAAKIAKNCIFAGFWHVLR